MVVSQRIGKRFEGSAFEKWPIFFDDDEDHREITSSFGTKPDLITEIKPPIMDEIKGIEMTEMESINNLLPPINGIRPPAPEPCFEKYCSRYGWESLDTNDGTGDHESFKYVLIGKDSIPQRRAIWSQSELCFHIRASEIQAFPDSSPL